MHSSKHHSSPWHCSSHWEHRVKWPMGQTSLETLSMAQIMPELRLFAPAHLMNAGPQVFSSHLRHS